jgi:hypothetical protein
MVLLIQAAEQVCLPSGGRVLFVTSGTVRASKDDAGGDGGHVSGFSPAGKEESW